MYSTTSKVKRAGKALRKHHNSLALPETRTSQDVEVAGAPLRGAVCLLWQSFRARCLNVTCLPARSPFMPFPHHVTVPVRRLTLFQHAKHVATGAAPIREQKQCL